MAAELSKEADVNVEKVRGGMGEFSVCVDDRKVAGGRLVLIPNVERILTQVRSALRQ